MRRLIFLGAAVAILVAACDDSGKSESEPETSLAGALTKGVKFDRGLIKSGRIGKADADRVKLSSTLKAMAMKPGGAAIMALGVDNPDQGSNPAVATLMQFEGSDSRIEVPIDADASQADAGAADAGASEAGPLEVENPWVCVDEICEHLCNRRLLSRLTFAIRLEDGSISEQREREVVLDCTKAGDPKACKPGDGTAGESPDGQPDASSATDGGEQAATDAASTDDGGPITDAGPAPIPPLIGALTPISTVAGIEVPLSISGTGFSEGAVVLLDGQPLATTFVSDVALTADVPADRTQQFGMLPVYVENVSGDARSRSNTLYLQVDPVAGAPLIYDYSPDNGVAGDKILIIAKNLAGETPQIYDGQGHKLKAGALGTISWPTAGSVDTIEVELPEGIATGPLGVSNSLGSFKGKIFSVGRNLTRIEGTELTSSSEYNTLQWSHLSGGDNLLATSFFTAHGDCATVATCTTKPWFMITFPSEQTVARIAIRGNREYAEGYDFLTAKFEVLDSDEDVLWEGTYDLPAPDRNLNLVLPMPVGHATAVRFSSLADVSDEPGFSELEVFGP